jgi:dephospho-CoA kinase
MILGLTGGFGCGKSSALACFESAGWNTSSADDICAGLYEHQDVQLVSELRKHWQNKVFYGDGKVNKKAIAEIVFNNDTELKWLCSVLHPLISREIDKILKNNHGKKLVVEVPLLFEAGWEKIFDKTVAVWTSADIQRKRLLDKGFTINDIEKRNSKQLPNDEKLERADYAILNTGDFEFLKEQCNNLINNIKEQE